MRLSVLAVSLVLAVPITIQAQHSSGAGSSSGGGGYSGGGSFGGSSGGSSSGSWGGGGSHGGGGYSGGGSSGGYSGGHGSGGGSSGGYSGGHGSGGGSGGGYSGGHGSGGSSGGGYSGGRGSGGSWGSHGYSGSWHGGNSPHSAPGAAFAYFPGATGVTRWDGLSPDSRARVPYFSTVPGEFSAVYDRLLDQTLSRIRVQTPADLKAGEPARVKIEKHEPGRVAGSSADKKGRNKAEAVVTMSLPKPCHGKRCPIPPPPLPPPLRPPCSANRGIAACGATLHPWRLSEEAYGGILYNCWDLRRRLEEAENQGESLRAQQQVACSAAPLSAECQAATRPLEKLESRIERLREQYEHCVLANLRSTVFSQARR